MKTLYLECNMGAAGDMLTAALLELHPDPEGIIAWLNGLGIPDTVIRREAAEKCGIRGTHVSVFVGDAEEESLDVSATEPGAGHEHEHLHEHGPDHGHDPDPDHADEHKQQHEHTPEQAFEYNHAHVHDGAHVHLYDHGHENDHEHGHRQHEHAGEHDHVHDHGHDHGHAHSHGHTHTHVHHHLSDIEEIVSGLSLPETVRTDIKNVYRLIAEAEAHVHGTTPDQIHFHEVGTMDAVMDVTAVCLLLHELMPQQIIVSPVHVGSGSVRCAHGVLPVPAPAAAYLLQGIPTYGGAVQGELCTPTGAALLKYFADSFGDQPVMRVEKIGCGMGKKDFPRANMVRAMLGETADARDQILELRCNIDDMTGEEISWCTKQLFAAGARDVFTTAIGMKKNRPGTLLTVICDPEKRNEMVQVLFRESSTLGIRETVCSRHILRREETQIQTEFGPLRVKVSAGYGVTKRKAEYDDLAEIAAQTGLSLEEVRRRVEEALDALPERA